MIPAGRYILLQNTWEMAANIGDLTTTFAALEMLEEQYDVNIVDWRIDAISKLQTKARGPRTGANGGKASL